MGKTTKDEPPTALSKTWDEAGTKSSEIAGRGKEWLRKANPSLGEKLDDTEAALNTARHEFEEKGFCTNYSQFNLELLRPFKGMGDGDKTLLAEIKGTLSMKPESRERAFVMWNVICFWIGFLNMAIAALITSGYFFNVLIFSGTECFTGYLVAYFFYFIFVCYKQERWMKLGFAVLTCYVFLLLGAVIFNYNGVLHKSIDVLKIIANTIVAYHAFELYKANRSTELL